MVIFQKPHLTGLVAEERHCAHLAHGVIELLEDLQRDSIRHMKTATVCALLVLAWVVPFALRAQSVEEVRDAEQKWFTASANADADELAELMHESFQAINFDGTSWDKDSWVRSLRAIENDSERLPGWRKAFLEYNIEEQRIRLIGATAVVTAWRKRDGAGLRFTHVWIWNAGRWRLANSQTTSLNPARCAAIP
jgi:hypothetical protein